MTDKYGVKVTVVTVVYNGAEYIERAIDSVAAQSYPNIEYIIVDGGSTDGTLEILERRKSDIARYISEPDKGIYDAMNKGIALSTGDWIYFLGCDDFLYPEFSDMCPRLKDPSTVYYGNVFHKGKVLNGEFNSYMLAKYPILHQAVFYPRMAMERYKYNLKYKVAADHYITIQCWHDRDIKFQYEDLCVARYMEAGFSAVTRDEAFEKDRLKIVYDNFGFIVFVRFLIRWLKDKMRKK